MVHWKQAPAQRLQMFSRVRVEIAPCLTKSPASIKLLLRPPEPGDMDEDGVDGVAGLAGEFAQKMALGGEQDVGVALGAVEGTEGDV